jgi:hypothetical protein
VGVGGEALCRRGGRYDDCEELYAEGVEVLQGREEDVFGVCEAGDGVLGQAGGKKEDSRSRRGLRKKRTTT